MNNLSIVIPVFNEKKAIISTIEGIHQCMKETGINYEIIIVNDGSTDETKAYLEPYNETFRIIEHAKNKGYGAALKTGIKNSTYDIIAITDADGTYPYENIPSMFKEIHKYNMIVGQRSFKALPLITKPAKWCISKLANYLAERKIPDINSGLRIFWKKDALRFFNIIPSGFSFTTTITLAMLTNNLEVKYWPIEYNQRKGKSKIRPFYDTINFIQLIIRTIMYFNPLKIFIPLALILILLAIGVFVYSLCCLPYLLNTTVAILFISAIQVLAIGMLADLIDKRIHINER